MKHFLQMPFPGISFSGAGSFFKARKILSFLLASVISFQIQAQLTGAQIGSAAFANRPISYAFDNNPNTWFTAQNATGGWVGLDLGTKHVITQIGFQPHDVGFNTLGVFEGANNADFTDGVPLYMIKQALTSTNMQTITIDNSRGFRYVRYIGPSGQNSRIAELDFYGHQSDGDDSKLTQITNLPTVVIHTENAEPIDTDKERYRNGIVTIISADGTEVFSDNLEIKGRGNASWGFPKKPYRMRLAKSTNLLGLPAKGRNWTLINNWGDKTLMRNYLAFDLSQRLGMPYTPAGTPVDVFLNGEYRGSYQLSDHIDIRKNRVDIDEMEKTDNTGLNLTGGYLIEIDSYANQEPPHAWFESQPRKIPVTIKNPDYEDVPEQRNYIINHFNLLEAAVFASNYTHPTEGYRKYLDIPTFIRHFLVGELSGNTDTYWSTYMYKKRGDDKFYTGPVWDFDIAFENDNRTYPINTRNGNKWVYASSGSAARGMRDFVNRIMSDETFKAQLEATYAYYRNAGILTKQNLTTVINAYEVELNESQKLNFTRWNPLLNVKVHLNPATYGSYAGEVDNVRNYINNRIDWMDEKLNYSPSPLTVKLVSFTLEKTGADVQLRWETAGETNSSHFDVEYSKDARNFTYLGTVAAHGTAEEKQKYNYIHTSVPTGTAYYRLKQVDEDGSHEYFVIRSIDVQGGAGVFVYPNPANNHLVLSNLQEGTSYEILDMQGRVAKAGTQVKGNSEVVDTSALPQGTYFIRFTKAGKVESRKIIIND